MAELEKTLSELERRRKAIEEIVLTEEEEKEAILEAKRKKWNRLRTGEYWKNQND
jgi:hypothetical protein